jgi:hypothetical protein
MPRRKHHEGGSAKDFFKKVGNFFKPVVKAVAKPAIEALKPIATAGLTYLSPETAPLNAVAVNSLGNQLEHSIQGWGVKLTHHQAHKLHCGGEIVITRKALVPSRPTHILSLHPERLQKLADMVKANHPKVAMMLHEGEGIKEFMKSAYKHVIKPIGKALAPVAIQAGKNYVNEKTDNKYSGLTDALGNAANKGIAGMGMKHHRRRHRRVGGGVPMVKVDCGIVSETSGEYVPVMGGAINTHGGMNANENYVTYPTQLGSPYAKSQSPAMNPFFSNHNQYAQYTPIMRMGTGINPPGGGGINPPGGGGIYPAGYRSRR